MARFTDLMREQGNLVAQLTKLNTAFPVRHDQVAFPEAHSHPSVDHPQQHLYENAIEAVAQAGRRVADDHALDLAALRPMAQALTDALTHTDHLLGHVLSGRTAHSSVATNCVHVAILAARLGLGIGLRSDELSRLTLAALIHDMGMFTVPDAVLDKSAALNFAERALVHDHPKRGAQLLAGSGQADDELLDIVEQEHERWNGEGYPRRLAKTRIHPHAQVIGLADVLDAMINPRPYHQQMPAHAAVRQLVTEQRDAFPETVLKVLLEQITLYPLGTTVRLNSGEEGTVVQLNRHAPLRPVLQLLSQRDAEAERSATIDLSHTPARHIVGIVTSTQPTVGNA